MHPNLNFPNSISVPKQDAVSLTSFWVQTLPNLVRETKPCSQTRPIKAQDFTHPNTLILLLIWLKCSRTIFQNFHNWFYPSPKWFPSPYYCKYFYHTPRKKVKKKLFPTTFPLSALHCHVCCYYIGHFPQQKLPYLTHPDVHVSVIQLKNMHWMKYDALFWQKLIRSIVKLGSSYMNTNPIHILCEQTIHIFKRNMIEEIYEDIYITNLVNG